MVMISSLEDIEKLMMLLKKHAIDRVELEGIVIVKSRHNEDFSLQAPPHAEEMDDATLFFSAQ